MILSICIDIIIIKDNIQDYKLSKKIHVMGQKMRIKDIKGSIVIITIIGFLLTIVALCLPNIANINLPLGYVMAPCIIVMTILAVFLNHFRISLQEHEILLIELENNLKNSEDDLKNLKMAIKTPKLIYGAKGINSYAEAMILMEPSNYFKYDGLVSFYYKNHLDMINLIGIGRVIFIHDEKDEDKKIQVELTHFYDEYKEIATKLSDNDSYALKRTSIYPYVTKTDLEKLYFNLSD